MIMPSPILLGLLACGTPGSDGPTLLDPHESVEPVVEESTLGDMVPASVQLEPPGSIFLERQRVVLTSSDPSRPIWYTLDGTLPVPGESSRYTAPLELEASAAVRAVAEASGGELVAAAGTFVRLQPPMDQFSTNLPVFVLWSEAEAPRERQSEYTPFSLTVLEPEGTERVALPSEATMSARAGLRVRGSTSAGFPKRPYRLELWEPGTEDGADLNVPLLDLPANADWVLLSPLIFDRALVRNALMYRLSREIGRYAPRTRFIEVFVAEQGSDLTVEDYVGVYVLVERIERHRDRVDITELDANDVENPEITGGYLFKEDRLGPGELGFTAGTADGQFVFEQPFVMVEPSEDTLQPAQADYLRDLLDELGDALASEDFVAPSTGRHYRDIIDVDAWIDHHILQMFAKNPDAFRLSGYFHKDRGERLAAGPVWDFDRTLGCADDGRASDPTWWDTWNASRDGTPAFEHGFWAGLFQDQEFTDAYWSRWSDLLEGPLAVSSVHAILDDMESELTEAAARNFSQWTDYPPRGSDYSAEIGLLKLWIQDRTTWIGDCLQLADPMACPGDDN